MKNIKIIDILKAVVVIMYFNMQFLGQAIISKTNWPLVTTDSKILTVVLASFLLVTSAGIVRINKESVSEVLLIVGPYIFAFVISSSIENSSNLILS